MDMNNKSEGKAKSGGEKTSFFQNLIASLFKTSNPDADKKKRLKALAKTFSKTKYHNFYKTSSHEVQGSLAKLLWEIYKAISPAQIHFKNAPNPGIFKRQIINYSLSERQLELLEHFDEQKIHEMSKQVPLEKVAQTIEEELQEFQNHFDNERMNKAENLYKAFSIFKDFCEFDFYVFLRKFDASIQEFQFAATPRLEKINDEYVVEDLKDFIAVAYAVTDDTIVWNDLFEMFKETQGKELVSPNSWKKIVAKIKNIQASKSLDMMIQLISQDPSYVSEVKYRFDPLIEPYVDKINSDTRQIIEKMTSAQKESKTSNLCMQIFGTAAPQALQHYVPSYNATLQKKDLALLEYPEPLNYLKAFIVEHVKREIREFYDVVVIRGQWDATLSAPISNAYQELLKASDDITIFDNDFSEEGANGIKIKTLLPKTAHDHGAENIINRVVSDCNDQAKSYLLTSTQNLITIGKTLKQLIEDYALQKPTIVANWKELDKYVEQPIKEFMVGIYKRIYLFVQLMQQYLK